MLQVTLSLIGTNPSSARHNGASVFWKRESKNIYHVETCCSIFLFLFLPRRINESSYAIWLHEPLPTV
jgi:hypothetical protein